MLFSILMIDLDVLSFGMFNLDGIPIKFLFKPIFCVTIFGSLFVIESNMSNDRYDPSLFISLPSFADLGVYIKFSSEIVSFLFSIFGNFGNLS